MDRVLLLPWGFVVVGASTISHEEDIFNQFLNPFLDKCGCAYNHTRIRISGFVEDLIQE
jgi:hypothetical protein